LYSRGRQWLKVFGHQPAATTPIGCFNVSIIASLRANSANHPPTGQSTPLTPPRPRPRLLTAPSVGAPALPVGSHGDRKSIVQRAPAPGLAVFLRSSARARAASRLRRRLAELADIVAACRIRRTDWCRIRRAPSARGNGATEPTSEAVSVLRACSDLAASPRRWL